MSFWTHIITTHDRTQLQVIVNTTDHETLSIIIPCSFPVTSRRQTRGDVTRASRANVFRSKARAYKRAQK